MEIHPHPPLQSDNFNLSAQECCDSIYCCLLSVMAVVPLSLLSCSRLQKGWPLMVLYVSYHYLFGIMLLKEPVSQESSTTHSEGLIAERVIHIHVVLGRGSDIHFLDSNFFLILVSLYSLWLLPNKRKRGNTLLLVNPIIVALLLFTLQSRKQNVSLNSLSVWWWWQS